MRILVASSIDPEAISKLREDHDVICAFNAEEAELKRVVADKHIIVFRSGVQITADVMASAPDLRLIIRAGSGIDNLDVSYVREHDITLIRIPEPGARAVMELTFAMMIMLARQVLTADSQLRKGHWLKHKLKGYLLNQKVLGIVGAGNIGSCVGQMGTMWGMRVIGCVEETEETDASIYEELRRKGIRPVLFEEVIRQSDFLTIHVPKQASTMHLIGERELSMMRPGSFLINTARGGVVDEAALYNALTGRSTLAGAALDVHEEEGEGKVSPLAGLPNVILTPHIGASTVDTQREIGLKVIQSIEEFVNENWVGKYARAETDA